MSSEEKRSRQVARRSGYVTVIITAVVGFIYSWILADQILQGDLLERLDPGVIPRLVNVSLFLVTGLPAIMAAIVSLSVHKVLSRDISQV